MTIDSEQLPRQLERGLAPLYTVFGDEPLLAIEAADRIRAAARARGHTERDVLTVESGFDWKSLWLTGASLSLFAERRIVELRIPTGAPGVEGSEAIVKYAADLPPDTVTLVDLPKIDKRSRDGKWFTALDGAGVTVEVKRVRPEDLPRWLAGRLRAQGQDADPATLEFLADRVEGNLLAAHQEVQKLALLFPPGRLDEGALREAVMDVARFEVFDLGPTVLKGDAARFVRILDGLRGEAAGLPLVLWALNEEVRALIDVHTATVRGVAVAQAMRDARIWGDRQKVLPQALRRVSASGLAAAVHHAARIDRIIKGVAPGNPWDELRTLGLRIATPDLPLPAPVDA